MTTPDAGRPVAPGAPSALPPSVAPGTQVPPGPSGPDGAPRPRPYGAPGPVPSGFAAPGPSGAALPAPYGTTAPAPYGTAPGTAPAAPYGAPPPHPGAPGAYGGGPAPYGPPLSGPPPYGPPPYPGPGLPRPAGRSTDGLAIASLVLSCAAVGTALLTAPVGLGLGIASLRRIRRTGAGGRPLAVGGVVVGAVLTVLLAVLGTVLVVTALTEDGTSTASGAPVWPAPDGALEGTTMPPFDLTDALVPGDCLAEAPETYDMSDAVPVDCADGHTTEVLEELAMAQPVLTDLTVPDAVYTDLLDRCQAVAEALPDPATVQEAGWTDVYYPHPDEWAAGGRIAYCVLTTEAPATGSARTGSFAPGTGTLPGAEV